MVDRRRPTVTTGVSAQPCADEPVTPEHSDSHLYTERLMLDVLRSPACAARKQRETTAHQLWRLTARSRP